MPLFLNIEFSKRYKPYYVSEKGIPIFGRVPFFNTNGKSERENGPNERLLISYNDLKELLQ